MQVRAIRDGFYKGRRVRAGAVFNVGEEVKGKWFEPVELSAKGAAKTAPKEPETFSEANAAAKDSPKAAAVKKALGSKNPVKDEDTLV